jgi:hypothetical protein
MLTLALDFREQRLMQAEGRVQQLAQARHPGQAGELQKYLVDVLADGLVGGHEAVVGVQPGGLRMVVAGAQVAVTAQALLLTPDHHEELCVRLVAEHAVHDVGAGFLKLVGEFNIGLFIEARAQLDDDRHVLAGLRGVRQCAHDGRVAAGAIQSLLDGQHLWVGGRLLDEIHDRSEALERLVQQHIAGAQGGENVGAHF